jgi:hypothetical protein
MAMHGVFTDVQELGDLLVSPSRGDRADDFDLTVSEVF